MNNDDYFNSSKDDDFGSGNCFMIAMTLIAVFFFLLDIFVDIENAIVDGIFYICFVAFWTGAFWELYERKLQFKSCVDLAISYISWGLIRKIFLMLWFNFSFLGFANKKFMETQYDFSTFIFINLVGLIFIAFWLDTSDQYTEEDYFFTKILITFIYSWSFQGFHVHLNSITGAMISGVGALIPTLFAYVLLRVIFNGALFSSVAGGYVTYKAISEINEKK